MNTQTQTIARPKSNVEKFNQWKAIEERTPGAWQVDSIHNGRTDSDLLMHKGRSEGVFISVDREGVVRLGGYEGACEHITDALFKTALEIKCENFKDAVDRICVKMKMTELAGLFIS